MATRNVTYQYSWGYATYDRTTEADRIADVEAKGEYLAKFDVTVSERELIDETNKHLKKIVDKPVGGGGGGGGSSTTNYSTRIKEDSGNADITYIGNAALGASESDPVWQIKQLYSATGLDKTWCDGNDNFDNVWTNRESLSYS